MVSVVTAAGGRSKGRPILIEDADTWRRVDLLIPNGLGEQALESFIAHKFSAFTVVGKPIRRLHRPTGEASRSAGSDLRFTRDAATPC